MIGLSICVSWYGIIQIKEVKEQYQKVIELSERSKAASAATNTLKSLGISAAQLSTVHDPDDLEYMKENAGKLESAFNGNVLDLMETLPGRRYDLENLQFMFGNIMAVFREMCELAFKHDSAGVSHQLSTRFDIERPVALLDSLAADIRGVVDDADHAAQTRYETTLRLTVALETGGVVGVLALALFLTLHYVSRPLGKIVTEMTGLSQGHLDIAISGRDRRDEIGATARAVIVFQRAMNETETLRAQQEELRAKGNEEKRAAFARLADEFERDVSNVVNAVHAASEQLRGAAEELSALAGDTTDLSTAVADSAGDAALNVDTVAVSVEQVSTSIADSTVRMRESSQLVDGAKGAAQRSNTEVTKLIRAAQQIDEITHLIAAIAAQTNLLALNAAIEAARAGEAGRGFAVVAQEVKSLANQTAEATRAVRTQIEDMQSAAARVAGTIHDVGDTIGEIDLVVSAVAAAMTQQSNAVEAIVRGAAQAADGTGNVRDIIGNVTRAANRSGKMAKQVLDGANDLIDHSTGLRGNVSSFLAGVRAG